MYVRSGDIHCRFACKRRFIDLGLFVLLAAVFFIMGSFDILFNGSAWLLYFLLNPVISFVALFVGKHFDYMPMK